MLAPLFGLPVLLFLAILPLTLLAAMLLWGIGAQNRAVRESFLKPVAVLALLLLAAAAAGHLLYAFVYLGAPNFSDHIEPNTAIVAWIYAGGGQIYHALDAPERYAFLYGPVPYIATAWVYGLLGASTFAAKLAGFICLLVASLSLVLAVWQRYSGRFVLCLVALGYFSLTALFFKNHSFWSKPDSFMIACAAIGLYACIMRPGRTAWVLCGIALGIAVNAKITGAIYFLPYMAWLFDRDGYRAPLVMGLAAGVVALLPFLSADQVSLLNYLGWLQAAGGHGLSFALLLQNVAYLVFIFLPMGLFLLWQQGSIGIRSWLVMYKLVAGAALLAALLILVAASKPGSGPHHFLPFLPLLAFMTTSAVFNVYSYRPTTNWSVYGFWAPLAAFLLAAAIKAGIALFFGLQAVMAQTSAVAIVDDLNAIVAANPEQNIYMGYGDGSKYTSTFLRHHLVYAGQPYLIDPPALMDFQFSGMVIPAATTEALLADHAAIWLVPAGQEAFMLGNWYYRHEGGLLFDESFRSAFKQHFVLRESTKYFDLYVPGNQD